MKKTSIKSTKSNKSANSKSDVYSIVTSRIIDELEKGIIPWQKPWHGTACGAFNRVTKKPYSLINQMLLNKSGEWATFKQWNELGGRIRKGEKSSIIVLWKIYQKPIADKNGNPKLDENGTPATENFPVLKYYNVYHISQVDGVEPLPKDELHIPNPDKMAEDIINKYINNNGPEFCPGISDKAYYSPLTDEVVIPRLDQYETASEYYSTAFHELTHSTGHKSRLDRFTTNASAAFGSEDYSKEELIAEIGAASLVNICGLEQPKTFKNSAAYIQSWLKVLKGDTRFIISAASKAEKAVNYIMDAPEISAETTEETAPAGSSEAAALNPVEVAIQKAEAAAAYADTHAESKLKKGNFAIVIGCPNDKPGIAAEKCSGYIDAALNVGYRKEPMSNTWIASELSSGFAITHTCDTLKDCRQQALKNIAAGLIVKHYKAALSKSSPAAADLYDIIIAYNKPSPSETTAETAPTVKGKSFCFTGGLRKMPRKDAISHIHALGGITHDKVVKALDYLVVADANPAGIKYNRALELNDADSPHKIILLSEDEFYKIIAA